MSERYMEQLGRQAAAAKTAVANADTAKKNRVLTRLKEILEAETASILAANAADLQAAATNGMAVAMQDRLRLTEERIRAMGAGLLQVSRLPDPTATTFPPVQLAGSLQCERKIVPFGVIAMIYEARPNVTIDATALGLKAGNAMILRGGSEALATNRALVACVQRALREEGLPETAVQLVERTERSLVGELLRMRRYVDLVIPRGGAGLIRFVVENSTVPVIETGSGICHIYVDAAADLQKAAAIIMNAKTQRPSVCNAVETLLVQESLLPWLATEVAELTAAGVEVRGDAQVCAAAPQAVPATEEDWRTEYNDLILSVRSVPDLAAALRHIETYGTRHSECIITEDPAAQERFLRDVDAAAVYVNASTRFTDGFEFGLGAEIGISTQKLHARGPMGLEALVTYKYCLRGNGEVRGE
ncbi:MAG: glutamate-5-semialdehyde dehydrogenase [Veillonellaceae bacterium]|nr:glutamate-5-semialdehyde dehydrogenase [Veillonellaceae bacterium]